jgi:hypothetical protein
MRLSLADDGRLRPSPIRHPPAPTHWVSRNMRAARPQPSMRTSAMAPRVPPAPGLSGEILIAGPDAVLRAERAEAQGIARAHQ